MKYLWPSLIIIQYYIIFLYYVNVRHWLISMLKSKCNNYCSFYYFTSSSTISTSHYSLPTQHEAHRQSTCYNTATPSVIVYKQIYMYTLAVPVCSSPQRRWIQLHLLLGADGIGDHHLSGWRKHGETRLWTLPQHRNIQGKSRVHPQIIQWSNSPKNYTSVEHVFWIIYKKRTLDCMGFSLQCSDI